MKTAVVGVEVGVVVETDGAEVVEVVAVVGVEEVVAGVTESRPIRTTWYQVTATGYVLIQSKTPLSFVTQYLSN